MVTDRASDDALADELGGLFRRADPVPAAVRHGAFAALAWRDPDAALATLVQDSAEDATVLAGARGDGVRLLTFQAGQSVLDVEVTAAPDGRRLTGQLVPMGPGTVTVCHQHTRREVPVDAVGRFAATSLDAGLVQLRCAPDDESVRRFNTEWFTI
jgi:hypothetical protein